MTRAVEELMAVQRPKASSQPCQCSCCTGQQSALSTGQSGFKNRTATEYFAPTSTQGDACQWPEASGTGAKCMKVAVSRSQLASKARLLKMIKAKKSAGSWYSHGTVVGTPGSTGKMAGSGAMRHHGSWGHM